MRPLIVAVERERTQVEQLTAAAARVQAELRLADSIDAALRLIDTELPDVILIPALLSSRDELALGSRLRDLGTAAAHVQTLTIPRFEPSAPPAAGRMLSFRRTKPSPSPLQRTAADAFADQLTVYLERATAIRPTPRREPDPAVPEPPPAVTGTPGDSWTWFDPSEPRFVALIARLDALAR